MWGVSRVSKITGSDEGVGSSTISIGGSIARSVARSGNGGGPFARSGGSVRGRVACSFGSFGTIGGRVSCDCGHHGLFLLLEISRLLILFLPLSSFVIPLFFCVRIDVDG